MQWTHFRYRNYYYCEDWADIHSVSIGVARGIILTLASSIVTVIINALFWIVVTTFNKKGGN